MGRHELLQSISKFIRKVNRGETDAPTKGMKPYQGSIEVSHHGSFSPSTQRNEVFFRYSAFLHDRRINSVDGSVRKGTYATTSSDATLVPSGLAAVGRYALPNHFPASYQYELRPPVGTSIFCGNSAPNYNQAGGGVEILFDAGCCPSTAILPPKSIEER